jgi:hypothetical protein
MLLFVQKNSSRLVNIEFIKAVGTFKANSPAESLRTETVSDVLPPPSNPNCLSPAMVLFIYCFLSNVILTFNKINNTLVTVLVDNQLDAQFFHNIFIYLNPLHVSSISVLILKRTVV